MDPSDTEIPRAMAAGGAETGTVLVVDDDPDVVESYSLYLEAEPYEVLTASNGAEALVELEPGVDVVLLDRRMPGMSGDEVLEHIRDWHADCHVVMVTAVDPSPEIVDMAFDEYLCKPVERDELVGTIERLLRFDRFEKLLVAHNAATRKYATLKASLDSAAFEASERIASLEAHREELQRELRSVVAEFEDDDVERVIREAYAPPPEG